MRLLLLSLILVSLLLAGFGPPVISDGGYPPVRLYPDQIAALEGAAQPPAITSASALLVDADAGQTLLAWHSDQPLAPASTAKVMTALVVLERAPITATVTVSAAAASTGGSRMGLVAGEILTVSDLLYGLLIPSGNDAAVALAEYVAGSEAGFVDLLNQQAASMGLKQTHFANAHGLDAPDEITTAADLMQITRAVLKYPLFGQIVSLASAQVAGHSLASTNQLLGNFPGADGIKTGTTDTAGECLIASVTRNGHRLLLVLLNSHDRYADAASLFKWAAANWEWRSVTLPDDALAWEAAPDGRSYRLQAEGSAEVFLPRWQWDQVQAVRVIDRSVPLTGTLPVGTLQLTLGRQVLATVPLKVWPTP